MSTSTTTAGPATDPASLTPARWQSRRAALLSHGAALDDPRVAECDAALAYWRVRRTLDRERESLAADHLPALADMLRHPHKAVMA